MFNPMKLLDSMQSEWPLLSSLMIVGTAERPHWADTSAQRVAVSLHPVELAVCRARLPYLVDSLAALHRRWVVTLVLVVLLALAVVSAASAAPLDALHLGILISVLNAILLPPLVIYNGIARDYVAARALAAVLCVAVERTAA
jgi:hypothetical protein